MSALVVPVGPGDSSERPGGSSERLGGLRDFILNLSLELT